MWSSAASDVYKGQTRAAVAKAMRDWPLARPTIVAPKYAIAIKKYGIQMYSTFHHA